MKEILELDFKLRSYTKTLKRLNGGWYCYFRVSLKYSKDFIYAGVNYRYTYIYIYIYIYIHETLNLSLRMEKIYILYFFFPFLSLN